MPEALHSSLLPSPLWAAEAAAEKAGSACHEQPHGHGPGAASTTGVANATHPAAPTTADRYRSCFEASHDGILLLDPRHQLVLDCNPALERLCGIPRRQIVERPLRQLDFLGEGRQWLQERMGSGPPTIGWRSQRCLQLRHRHGGWLTGIASVHGFVADDSPILQFTFTPSGSIVAADAAHPGAPASPMAVIHGVISSLSALLQAHDPYTQGHQARVAELCRSIATCMGLDADRIEGLCVAALLHDIGKIAIGMELLTKPTPLKPEEFQLIKTHVQTSYEVLGPIPFPWPVATIVHQHHERLDGSGYPLGLRGDQILLEAQILAVADTVESMITDRPYRRAKGMDAALKQIEGQRGVQLRTEVVDACLWVLREQRDSAASPEEPQRAG